MRSWRRSIDFLEKHRVIIVVGTLLIAVAGLPLLYFMKFDFNPINLRNPKVESIATFLDLRKDPNTGANAINVMTHFGSRGEEDRGAGWKSCRKSCA